MKQILTKLFLLNILIFTTLYAKPTLYVNIVDLENMISIEEHYSHKMKEKFKFKDLFFTFDAKNMQYISSIKFTRDDIRKYKDKRLLVNRFKKRLLKSYEKRLDIYNTIFIKEKILTEAENDFARQMKVVKNIISAYGDKYNIKVMFFGNSYLHNANGNIFSKGIPSDGFIYLDESEFNTFSDIGAKDVEFSILFDDEPVNDKNKLFRFYKKLFKKKFNSELKTFNDSATLYTEKDLDYMDKPFKKDVLTVVGEKMESDCTEHDQAKGNYLDQKAKLEVVFENICRKDSLITFYHNGSSKQIILDKLGRGKVYFNAQVGINRIHYYDLNGDEKMVYEEEINAASNDVKFSPSPATSEVTIEGFNPLRGDDSQVKIYYKTTGSYIYMDVKDGKFGTTVPIQIGHNIFTWKDMNGGDHSWNYELKERCTDQIELDKSFAEEYGIAQITLKNDCREDGSIVEFFYKDKNYTVMSVKGESQVLVILNSDINDIFYKDFDSNRQKAATIKIRDFKDLIRFNISYQDNVLVLMNIFEPIVKIDSTNKVFSINYNEAKRLGEYKNGHLHIQNPKSKNGEFVIIQAPSTSDYLKENFIQEYRQVYVTRKSLQTKGNLYFYVDYFSRHGNYGDELPLCGDRSLGGVVINYDILNNGENEKSTKFLNPSRCIKNIEDGGLIPKNEENELLLIQKVEIK